MKTHESRFAIIGMACQFPKARNIHEYWNLLINGQDGVDVVPQTRWNWKDYYCEGEPEKGMIASKWGGFVDNIEGFDADFFNIPSEQAERIDPQQRLVLETTRHCFEHAGIVPSSLSGSNTGVYIGISHSDHGRKLNSRRHGIDENVGPDHYHCFAANRLSYFFNFKGPSIAVDAACASTHVALNQAIQALSLKEIDMAVVGAVNAHLLPEESIYCSLAGLLSPDGRCYAFDKRGQGFSRSEGCGIIIIRRLNDAELDNQNVHAVIQGVAIGHSGLTNRITSPSSTEQQAVIQQAIKKAGIGAQEISYVEAHGTGSVKGDACEYRAITSALKVGRSLDQPCYIGSVKSSIGHLEAASGVAAIIKIVLCFKNNLLVGNRNFKDNNELIGSGKPPFEIVRKNRNWSEINNTLYAGVNTYSFGGVNGHMVLASSPNEKNASGGLDLSPTTAERYLLVLSAASIRSLELTIQSFGQWLEKSTDCIQDIVYTCAVGRQHFKYRIAIVAQTKQALLEKIVRCGDVSRISNMEDDGVYLSMKTTITRKLLVYLSYNSSSTILSLIKKDKSLRFFRTRLCRHVLVGLDDSCTWLEELLSGDKTCLSVLEEYLLLYMFTEYMKNTGVQIHLVSGDGMGEVVALTQAKLISFVRVTEYLRNTCQQSPEVENIPLLVKNLLTECKYVSEEVLNTSESVKELFIDKDNPNLDLITKSAKHTGAAVTTDCGLQWSALVIGERPDIDKNKYSLIKKNFSQFSKVVTVRGLGRYTDLKMLARLYSCGVSIRWDQRFEKNCHKFIALPPYEFDKKYLWYS